MTKSLTINKKNSISEKSAVEAMSEFLGHDLGRKPEDVSLFKKEIKYDGFFKLSEYTLSHKLFNGDKSSVMTREIFERGDAVVLMPYDPVTDSVVVNVQFRPGALRTDKNPWLIEFVAGMFGENESPIDVAIREAKEEANLDILPENVTGIMQYLSSAGGTNEMIHLFVATIDSANIGGVFGLPEEGEDILVKVVPRELAMKWLAQGLIYNAATVIGLQWLQMNYLQIKEATT